MNDAGTLGRSAIDAYRSGAVLNSPRLKLVRMVYAGAIREVKRGLSARQKSDRAEFGVALGKAQALIGELMGSLDHSEGADIARSLEGLYEFCLWNLTQANLHFSAKPLEDTLGILTPLQEAWENIEDPDADGA